MEHVRVEFDVTGRIVLVDDQEGGLTNKPMRVDEGPHKFSLDGPKDYTPAYVTTDVTGTSPKKPLRIRFKKISDDA